MTVLGVAVLSSAVGLLGCGATRGASSPQKAGQARLTAAKVAPRIEKVLVAEKGNVSMVARDGCVATITSVQTDAFSRDELGVRCPKKERMKKWFEGIDRLSASLPLEKIEPDDDEEIVIPAAHLVLANGKVMNVKDSGDAGRLASEVRALSAELAAVEMPAPGPASPAGWQMLHVSGVAHVVFAGTPARGLLDAHVSTNGQYFCAFDTDTEEGPLRATKSGYIDERTAANVIDEVLSPFKVVGPSDKPRAAFVEGTTKGTEKRADIASTAAAFERFAPIQDKLGDACLPELEPPVAKTDL